MPRRYLLTPVLLVLFTVLTFAQPAATKTLTATVPYFDFTPREGGPGTVVHLTGGLYFNPDPFAIYISRVDTYPLPLQSARLATARADTGGNWTATITIPDRWGNGEPITERSIYIVATGNNQNPFSFTPRALPAAGGNEVLSWIVVQAILGLLVVIGGVCIKRLSARHLR